jgi:hypothetical protein
MTIRFTYCNHPVHTERVYSADTRRIYNYDIGANEEVEGTSPNNVTVESDRAFWTLGFDCFTGESGAIAKADINDYHMMGHHTDEWKKENDSTEVKPGTLAADCQGGQWEISTLCRVYLKGVHIGCVIKLHCSWYGVGDRWKGYRLDADGVYRLWIHSGQDRESVVGTMCRTEAHPYDEETAQRTNFDGTPETDYNDKPVYHNLTLAEIWTAAQGGTIRAGDHRREAQLESAAIVNGVVIFGLRN